MNLFEVGFYFLGGDGLIPGEVGNEGMPERNLGWES